jgi:hypothetical protein
MLDPDSKTQNVLGVLHVKKIKICDKDLKRTILIHRYFYKIIVKVLIS